MILSNVSENGQTLSFNFNILAMDIVDESKEATTNIFRGNDNEMDVMNTQLAVLNKFLQILRKGQTYREGYQVEGAANLEPFSDRFENQVSGWALNFTLVVMNNIDICDD
jgi:hypothetical protein